LIFVECGGKPNQSADYADYAEKKKSVKRLPTPFGYYESAESV